MIHRHIPSLLLAALVGSAATLALVGVRRDRAPIVSLHETPPNSTATASEGTLPPAHPPVGNGSPMTQEVALPPNHPPIGNGEPRVAMPAPMDEPPTLSWKMPNDWQEAPNPSRLRLATYHVPGGAEMSVARAGGSTEANIQRWLSQFDNAGVETRDERTIHGLHVSLVQVAGTYSPSPMMMASAAPQAQRGWALLGAIAETPGSPYFFKLLGPSPAIKAARGSFDKLLASFTPR